MADLPVKFPSNYVVGKFRCQNRKAASLSHLDGCSARWSIARPASTICIIQSPQRILTFFVARTDCPHFGQTSLRVLLGRLPPGIVLAPVWAAPPAAPMRMKGGRQLRPILISFQFFESAYSTRFSPGVVFQPYCPHGMQLKPWPRPTLCIFRWGNFPPG